jgi:recombination protein RecA
MSIEFDPKALQATMDAVNKYYGENTVLNLEEGGTPLSVIPFNDPILDPALKGAADQGGVPRYRMIEIYGPESSGKTTVALEIIASEMQIDPRPTLYIDAEHALDKGYAEHIGLDPKRCILNQPSNGKEALTVAREMIKSGQVSVAVIDSWASLITEDEEKAEQVGDKKTAGSARLASDGLKQMVTLCGEYKTTLIVINQQRVNLTRMGAFGKITSGGNAMKYYPSLRLEIKTHGSAQEANQFKRTLRVAKSKCQAPVFSEVEFYLGYGIGIDRVKNLMQKGLEEGIIIKSGAWFSYGEKKLGQGLSRASQKIVEDEDLRVQICNDLDVLPFVPRKVYSPVTSRKEDED